MLKKSARLDGIANQYHKGEVLDIHIENICQEYEANWILEVLGSRKSVVDLGYGDGLISPKLATAHDVTLIEGSADLVELAVRDLATFGDRITVINEFFEEFKTDKKFDAVVASHVLEHVDDPKELLLQINGWMKPDGLLVVVVPNAESIHRRAALAMGLTASLDELSNRDVMVGHQRVYTSTEIMAEIELCGFEIISTRGFFIKPLSNSQMLEWSIELLEALNNIAADLPASLAGNFGCVARKKS